MKDSPHYTLQYNLHITPRDFMNLYVVKVFPFSSSFYVIDYHHLTSIFLQITKKNKDIKLHVHFIGKYCKF